MGGQVRDAHFQRAKGTGAAAPVRAARTPGLHLAAAVPVSERRLVVRAAGRVQGRAPRQLLQRGHRPVTAAGALPVLVVRQRWCPFRAPPVRPASFALSKPPPAPQDAPHERFVRTLLSPPWVFVHEAHSPHFFLKLMTADACAPATWRSWWTRTAWRRAGAGQHTAWSSARHAARLHDLTAALHDRSCDLWHRRVAVRRACASLACSSAACTPQTRHLRCDAWTAKWPCSCLYLQWCAACSKSALPLRKHC